MASCSVCYGTFKIKVGNDLYWCTKCAPKDQAGLLTDEVEELTRKFVPASSNMKFYKLPSNTVVYHSAQMAVNQSLNAPAEWNGTVSFTPLDEGPVEEPPQPPAELVKCASCGRENSLIIVKKVESWEIYSFQLDTSGDPIIWAEFQNSEPGEILQDSKLECIECGHLSSIPESYTLEYS